MVYLMTLSVYLTVQSTDFSRRWDDTIKMDHKEIGWEDMDSIHLTQSRGQ
jgi:hypothetical protein